ncbi:MAG: diguanylate cyclase [Candidatus Puniceispirillaceae bacterium]
MDTVLVGGGGFLLAAGAIFLAIDKIGKSEMADRRKRLLTYALIAALIALTISIFHWHRAVYLAANG